MSDIEVKIALSDAETKRIFPVMRELRPHLRDEADFLARVERQRSLTGWQLIYPAAPCLPATSPEILR